ncbi:hypothetical protein PGTUg99_026794 [Puccinia graminis f. sp. tritici]|uniref:Uncharacterized protein n=1 Tax=Puccinia graminis f. sp. tritici TaxID=56615 RepID=A0A5B0SJ14_PUCGR|nr:hypothetical protein PGTUg99_026794 [Puccinia graminis f. sp. tritici]
MTSIFMLLALLKNSKLTDRKHDEFSNRPTASNLAIRLVQSVYNPFLLSRLSSSWFCLVSIGLLQTLPADIQSTFIFELHALLFFVNISISLLPLLLRLIIPNTRFRLPTFCTYLLITSFRHVNSSAAPSCLTLIHLNRLQPTDSIPDPDLLPTTIDKRPASTFSFATIR